MLTISNQQNFTGKAHFIRECTQIPQGKVSKILEGVQFDKKPYDLYISNESIIAKRTRDKSNPIAPNVTTMIKPKKDSIEYALKFTMETFENILNNLKA